MKTFCMYTVSPNLHILYIWADPDRWSPCYPGDTFRDKVSYLCSACVWKGNIWSTNTATSAASFGSCRDILGTWGSTYSAVFAYMCVSWKVNYVCIAKGERQSIITEQSSQITILYLKQKFNEDF